MSAAGPTREQVEAGQPYLVEQDGLLTLAFSELAVQSTMDIADPARLVLEYSHLMVASLAFVPAARRIALIGLGGGSLVKACHRHLPQTRLEVAELSPEVIALRGRFHVPPDDERLSIHCIDGAEWIARHDRAFDLVWVDGFDIGGMAPALTSPRFFDACHDALADGGVFAMNMYARDALADAWTERIAAGFARSVAAVTTADGDNRVVFAARGRAFRLSEARLAQQTRRLERMFGIALPGFARDFIASRRRLAEGVPA
ncbi:fused MFS/spermidine synthase [Methyloversatilis thermotolerans]|uniref:fused MFS/spermidine synthase n=1 Tax=Methyloversatilis thermotolerans TaxID=1346290 RepID=UPI00035C30B7|nr:fused MFS/spermidine synthase [Methyloversatilis thermotolerans]